MGLQSFPLGLRRLLDIGVPLNDSFRPGFICDDGSSLASDTPTTSGIPRGIKNDRLGLHHEDFYLKTFHRLAQRCSFIVMRREAFDREIEDNRVIGVPWGYKKKKENTRLSSTSEASIIEASRLSLLQIPDSPKLTSRQDGMSGRTCAPFRLYFFTPRELNLSSQVNKQLEQIEWTGTLSDRKSPDSNAESEDETNPIKILATHAGVGAYSKKHRVEKTMKSLVKPEDLDDQETVLNGVVSKSGYIDTLCEKIDKPRENKRGSFKPYKTLSNSDVRLKENVPKRAPHSWWEVTAATPPLPIHSNTKLVSLHQSLQLQQEQAVQLKAIQVKQAASRLSSRSNVHMSSTLPHDVLRGEHHSDFDTEPDHGQYQHHSDSDIEEAHSQAEEDTVVMFSLDYD
uniref:Uncharacterized protein n=1 Tax=Timema shepardi TaxID=629360 RepID=A0A7R9G0Q8_TIMSH|nr:unnamed protein product [Timema shepardi]